MQIAVAAEVEVQGEGYGRGNERGLRAGVVDRQWLLSAVAEDGLGFRFFRSTYREGEDAFESPRHHHAFQQIRWTESGSVNYAPGQDIAAGDICYFPRGTYYGPQRKDQGVGWLIQFGMAEEFPAHRMDRSSRRRASLETVGAGGGAMEERPEDALALREERDKTEVAIPPARYEAPILMHPDAFEYFEAGSGLEVKRLGSFYDQVGPRSDVSITMVRLSEGGAYVLGADRAQLGWSIGPGLKIDDLVYPALTCFYSPRGEQATVVGVDGVEAYIVEFPRLD